MNDFLLLILLLVITGALQAQVDQAFKSIKIRGLMRGVEVTKLIDKNTFNGYPIHLQSIQVVDNIPNPKINILGRCIKEPNKKQNRYDANIYLKRNLLYNQEVLEVVLAHEIGHLLGLQHDDLLTIMQPIAITQRGDENYDNMYRNNQHIWDKYFEKLINENKD